MIDTTPCLKGKDVPKIRSFLQGKFQKKTTGRSKRSRKGKRRITSQDYDDSDDSNEAPMIGSLELPTKVQRKECSLENNICVYFKEFIDNNQLPSVVDCLRKYEQIPELVNFSPADIRSCIENALEKKN